MNVKMSFIRTSGAALLAFCLVAAPAAAQDRGTSDGRPAGGEPAAASPDSLPTYASADGRVYLTRDEALTEIFADGLTVRAERWTLTEDEAGRIRSRSGVEVPGREPIVYRVLGEGEQLLGYAMILEERGKYRPITMMVRVTPDFTVKGVEVMVYREDRGEEVRYDRFLQQYREKGTGDAIRTHRDIMNVTGATISVHSMNDGVRRALHTVKTLYGDRQQTAGAGGGERAAGKEPVTLARWQPGASR